MRQLAVLGLAVLLVGCTSATRYRSSGRTDDLRLALRDEVRNGASVDHVQQLLGPGREARGDEQRRLVSLTRQVAQRTDNYPSGTWDDDRFIGYASKEGSTLFLQFRANKLINFNPADFARADVLRVAVSGGEKAGH
jgi:hypothetical protein